MIDLDARRIEHQISQFYVLQRILALNAAIHASNARIGGAMPGKVGGDARQLLAVFRADMLKYISLDFGDCSRASS